MRKFGASLLLQQNLAPGGAGGKLQKLGNFSGWGPLSRVSQQSRTGEPAGAAWWCLSAWCCLLPHPAPSRCQTMAQRLAGRMGAHLLIGPACSPPIRLTHRAPCPQRPGWAGGGSPDPSPCPLRALATQPQTCFSSGTQRCSPSDALAQESGCSCLTRAPGLLWGRFKEFSETS